MMRNILATLLLLSTLFSSGQSGFVLRQRSQSEVNQLLERATDLTKYLPRQHLKNGTVDYTTFIQRGLNENRIVKLPNFPISVNFNGLKLLSNSTIIFQAKSRLIMEPNNKVGYSVLWLENVENIAIINADLVGDREQHLGSQGQWGMGLRIIDSKNILIQNPMIRNCWGDGIYFGDDLKNPKINENVTIFNAKISKSRRNGITITSGKNIKVLDAEIVASDGTMPMSGLDIEPNDKRNILSKILIRNLKTANRGAGLIISLAQLKGSHQVVTIQIDNHVNEGGTMGLYVGLLEDGKSSLSGSIVLNNVKYSESRNNGILVEGYSGLNSPKLIFNNPTIINPNSESQKSSRWGSGIVFLRDSRRAASQKLGNFLVKDAVISDTRSVPKMRAGFHFIDDKKADFINAVVTGKITINGIPNEKFFDVKGKGVEFNRITR